MNARIKTLQDNRAFRAFVLVIFTATAFIAFASIGAASGMRGLISTSVSLFYEVFCHCISITVCGGTEAASFWGGSSNLLQASKVIFFWIGIGILATGFIKAIIKAAALLLNDRRFIKSIPDVSLDEYPRHKGTLLGLGLLESFVLLRDDSLKHSFTLGMWRPKIYMSTGTYSSLTDEEFVSAILHEDYHRRHRDPLRLFVVTVLRELLFFLPSSNYLTKVFLEAKEKAADDNAVCKSGKPLELASAIVKLIKPTQGLSPAYLANSMSDMDTVEERVRRLVEPGVENTKKSLSRGTLFLSAALCSFFFGAIFVNGVALRAHEEKVTPCVSHCCSTECGGENNETNPPESPFTKGGQRGINEGKFWGHVLHAVN